MDYQEQLKLQAYLDGELPEAEANAVAEWLAKDQQAAALLAELRHTTASLAGFEQSIRLPESREFFWSKVRRGIEAQELHASTVEAHPTVSWSARLRRFLMPAAGIAIIGLLGLIVSRENAGSGSGSGSVETSLADGGGVVYHDFSAGATFVWLSYPPDSDSSDEEDTGSLE